MSFYLIERLAHSYCTDRPEADRPAFVKQFMTYRDVGGSLDWHPVPGWGLKIKAWVSVLLLSVIRLDSDAGVMMYETMLAEIEEGNHYDRLLSIIGELTPDMNGPKADGWS